MNKLHKKTNTMTVHEDSPEAIMALPAPGELSEGQLATIRLFELPDDKFKEELPKFVQERTVALSEGTSRSVITADSVSFSAFIAPDRPLFPTEDVPEQRPFILDDPKAYEDVVHLVRSAYVLLSQKFTPLRALRDAALRGSFQAQASYFGSYWGNNSTRLDRLEKPEGLTASDPAPLSVIGDAAMCMERAAVVHNSLLLMGVPSMYCIGYITKYDNDGKQVEVEDKHAFLEIEGKEGNYFMYDPSNVKVIEYPEKNVSIVMPTVQQLDSVTQNDYSVPRMRNVGTESEVTSTPNGTWAYHKNTEAPMLGRIAIL